MTFQPVLPAGGYLGWRFLARTLPAQTAALAASPVRQREEAYFRANIGRIDSAEQLVADRRLLAVALGAFGLEGDLASRAFVRKVLESSTLDPKSLANRLADKRYAELARAFGFGDFATPRSKLSDFPDRILAAWRERGFEVAVGEQDETLRLALGGRRELAALAARSSTERAKWFTVMGTPPLRKVFETAFGLPKGFAALDLDQQLAALQAHARRAFGEDSVAQFADPARMEALVRRFLIRAGLAEGGPAAVAPARAALTLLEAAAPLRPR